MEFEKVFTIKTKEGVKPKRNMNPEEVLAKHPDGLDKHEFFLTQCMKMNPRQGSHIHGQVTEMGGGQNKRLKIFPFSMEIIRVTNIILLEHVAGQGRMHM